MSFFTLAEKVELFPNRSQMSCIEIAVELGQLDIANQ